MSLEAEKVMWFNSGQGSVGIVLAKNELGEKKAYIKHVAGFSERADTQAILDWESKMTLEQAEDIVKHLKSQPRRELILVNIPPQLTKTTLIFPDRVPILNNFDITKPLGFGRLIHQEDKLMLELENPINTIDSLSVLELEIGGKIVEQSGRSIEKFNITQVSFVSPEYK